MECKALFYVDRRLGLATVNTDNNLSLSTGTKVDLGQKVECYATWTIVTSIAKYWIVSGDFHSQAVIESINEKGEIRSKIELNKTSNGCVNREGREYEDQDSSIDSEENDYAGIYSLHQAYVRGRRGIMLAIERDGCCHLIFVVYGGMSKLQSIGSIVNVDVNESNRVVHSVAASTKGEFIAGGDGWAKRMSLKLL